MVVILQILIIGGYMSCYSAQNLFDKFMPGIRTRLGYASYPYAIRTRHVPLYMQSGPNPFMDYMIHPLIPRRMFKRFRRQKRQLAENDQRFQDLLDSFGGNAEMPNTKQEIEADSISSDIKAEPINSDHEAGSINSDIKAEPINSNNEAGSINSDIKAEPINTNNEAGSIHSDIKAEPINTNNEAGSIHSDIKAEPINSDIEAESINSDIKAASINSDVETESVNSDMETSTVRNGFYFLLDWNSFIEVDDLAGRRVAFRINPKVGDPKRFLSVSVP